MKLFEFYKYALRDSPSSTGLGGDKGEKGSLEAFRHLLEQTSLTHTRSILAIKQAVELKLETQQLIRDLSK